MSSMVVFGINILAYINFTGKIQKISKMSKINLIHFEVVLNALWRSARRQYQYPGRWSTVTLSKSIVDVHVYFNQVVNGTLSILLGSLGIFSGTLFELPL